MLKYQYTVAGIGSFPVDMLRYDVAYVETEDPTKDVRFVPYHEMDRVMREEARAMTLKRLEIVVYSNHLPTVARWNSFGWTALNVSHCDNAPANLWTWCGPIDARVWVHLEVSS